MAVRHITDNVVDCLSDLRELFLESLVWINSFSRLCFLLVFCACLLGLRYLQEHLQALTREKLFDILVELILRLEEAQHV